jgi:hypothetical protein
VKLGDALKEKVKEINGDKARLQAVKDWIDGAYGAPKIVSFMTDGESYHLVLTEKGAELREGDYPNFNLSYRGNVDVILKVLNKQASAKSVWQNKEIHVWGGLSEATSFEDLI